MAAPYKLTIPTNASELADHLGWMVLACPDLRDEYPGRDLQAAFDELNGGIDRVSRKFDPKVVANLKLGARKAKEAFEAGDGKAGRAELDRMMTMLDAVSRSKNS